MRNPSDQVKEEGTLRISILAAVALAVVVVGSAAGGSSAALPNIGRAVKVGQPVYRGYYDHHVDTYLITDTSNKAQSAAMNVNFSAEIGTAKGLPLQYFVRGRAAPGQITVFGSEPGESDYNPLWEEVWVTWKPGVTPVLLGQDDQINALAKAGKLTMTDAHVVLNAPIVTVGKDK
jgi:hypothetical protein